MLPARIHNHPRDLNKELYGEELEGHELAKPTDKLPWPDGTWRSCGLAGYGNGQYTAYDLRNVGPVIRPLPVWSPPQKQPA